MAKDSEQEMKDMVATIITNLGQKGIKVDSAAVLKMSGNTQDAEKVIQDTLKVQEVKSEKKQGQTQKVNAGNQAPYGLGDSCFCPNCFRFDNFEKVLTPLGGEFDYVSFSLLGKIFDLKFHRDAKGRENMMIEENTEAKIAPELTVEEIQNSMNEAIQRKDFDVAQRLLDELNNRKNQ